MTWAPDYITRADLSDYVRIHPDADDVDDAQLDDAVTAGARSVDGECQRQFGNVGATQARYYTPRWSKTRNGWLVAVDDIPAAAGVLVALDTALDGTFATPVTTFQLRPSNSVALGKPYEAVLIAVPSGVRVQGVPEEVRVTVPSPGFGWAAIPTAVKLANKLQSSRFLTRRDAPFGVAGNLEQGSELRLLAKVDPDVAVILKDYRRRVMVR